MHEKNKKYKVQSSSLLDTLLIQSSLTHVRVSKTARLSFPNCDVALAKPTLLASYLAPRRRYRDHAGLTVVIFIKNVTKPRLSNLPETRASTLMPIYSFVRRRRVHG